jgi:hypothetical protein
MRLRAASPEKIVTASPAASGPVLAAVPLGALALVPLVAGRGVVSVLAACALLGLSAVCLRLGALWPARVELYPLRRVLRRRRRRAGFEEVQFLELTAAAGSPAESYEVRVRLRNGSDWLLLSGPDPARVLRELRVITRITDLPVQRGWGIPSDARPWLDPPADAQADPSSLGKLPQAWDSQLARPLVVLSMRIAAALTACIIGMFVSIRIAEAKQTSVLSLALGVGLVLVLLAVSWAAALERIQVQGDGTLLLTTRS